MRAGPGLLTLTAFLICAASPAATLDEQRAAFRDVYPEVERGNWAPAAKRADVLSGYVLWPDLRATYLRKHLADDEAAVNAFLDRYGNLKPARELRYRYALSLAKRGRYTEYLALYDRFYTEIGESSLDCYAALAHIRGGDVESALPLAHRLWLVGRSQADQCDPVFGFLRTQNLLPANLVRERYALAIDARQFMLARYLARSIDDATLAEANRWLRSQGDPRSFLRRADVSRADATYNEQLAYAARRLAFSDPLDALAHWRRLGHDIEFSDELDLDVTRHAALWAARLRLAEAGKLLLDLDPLAVDDEVRRWQIRTALRADDWEQVIKSVDGLTGREREREEWRYWRAMALERTGRRADAMLALASLAQERSYHGFLAADHLGVDYALSDRAMAADEAIIARLALRDDLIRARELFHVGLDGKARSEWDAAVRALSADATPQAAVLAQRWNWHSRAIAGAARAGEYDDLSLRYPLPHREAVRRSASESGIPESLVYGVARSESLFMRDIRSSAGAVGVMQLMPSTGRQTAKEIRQAYQGRNTLIDPASNIRLGTRYLAKMHDRFDQHPALATAAYNAGPLRVREWLPDTRPIDARIWVETIPFNETRSYVRRVLASDVIFHWRLTGQTNRLSTRLPVVSPPADARVARQ